jgi:hypothetical protein
MLYCVRVPRNCYAVAPPNTSLRRAPSHADPTPPFWVLRIGRQTPVLGVGVVLELLEHSLPYRNVSSHAYETTIDVTHARPLVFKLVEHTG